MKFKDCTVTSYAGYKSCERPTDFQYEGRSRAIIEIIDRWYEGCPEPGGPYLNYFKVRADDGKTWVLRYNGLFDAWAVVLPDR